MEDDEGPKLPELSNPQCSWPQRGHYFRYGCEGSQTFYWLTRHLENSYLRRNGTSLPLNLKVQNSNALLLSPPVTFELHRSLATYPFDQDALLNGDDI